MITWGIVHLRWPKFIAELNLKMRVRCPKTFNELILQRMSKPVSPLYTEVAGRISLREFVKKEAEESLLPAVLQIHEKPQEIDWHALPEEYVIKANHGSGSILISKKVPLGASKQLGPAISKWKRIYLNPTELFLHIPSLIVLLDSWMQMDYSYSPVKFPEPWYSKIPRAILIEELLQEKGELLPRDFKFFVFHGEVKLIRVDTPQHFGTKSMSHFDENWISQNTTFAERRNQNPYKQTMPLPEKPHNLSEMIRVASKLGKKFDFVRVDMFNTDSGIRIGEMTLAPTSGQGYFSDTRLNEILGSHWRDETLE